MLRAIASLVPCLASVAAQAPQLEVRLAADPRRDGPPAWTWLREEVLVHVSGDRSVDPLAALRVLVTLPATIEVTTGTPPEAGYARAMLRSGDRRIASIELLHDGRETWRIDAADAVPARLRDLAALLPCRPGSGVLTIDIATLTGNLMAAATEGDLASAALTFGARECGNVEVMTARALDGALEVSGRSEGGLLLPAALACVADLQRHGVASWHAAGARAPSDLERWLVLASSAQFDDREEAARQLGRFSDERAARALLGLLHGEPSLRSVAIASLARSGHGSSLGAILTAAAGSGPEVASVACAAVETLWPSVSAAERARALARMLADARPEFRALAGRLAEPSPPHATPARGGRLRDVLLSALSASCLALVLLYFDLRGSVGAARRSRSVTVHPTGSPARYEPSPRTTTGVSRHAPASSSATSTSRS